MITFNIIGMNTGFKKGTITGLNYQDAENKCLEKGIDMYDQYMLVDSKKEVISASLFINEILER